MKDPNKPIPKDKKIHIPDDPGFDIESMRKSIKKAMSMIHGKNVIEK